MDTENIHVDWGGEPWAYEYLDKQCKDQAEEVMNPKKKPAGTLLPAGDHKGGANANNR